MIARTRLYIDTSILGATTDPGPPERITATRELLEGIALGKWEAFISTLVLSEVDQAAEQIRRTVAEELRGTSMLVLEETVASVELARRYVDASAIPVSAENDARHIAIASVHDIRIIVSWNFRHMVNIERKRRINAVNLAEGFPLIDLVSPWEVRSDEA